MKSFKSTIIGFSFADNWQHRSTRFISRDQEHSLRSQHSCPLPAYMGRKGYGALFKARTRGGGHLDSKRCHGNAWDRHLRPGDEITQVPIQRTQRAVAAFRNRRGMRVR